MKRLTALLATILLTACFCRAADTPAKIPVLLDTDIGTDIDDAFALALVIKSPEFELLGVTTVSGDTAARAHLAAKFLWEAGGKWRQVPVVAGPPEAAQPIEQTRWADGFVSPQILKESAVDFLRSELHRHPGQITLIAIGELTNVAALIKADPLAAKEIKRIALMGGSIARGYGPGSKPEAEWNIKSNPAAARTVLSSGIPIVMAPLDVTAMLKLDAAARSRIFSQNTPITNSLAALYHLWNQETPTLFDPMAVALVLDPGLCQTKELAVEVDSQGFTRIVDSKTSNTTVGLSTDAAKFFDFYLARVAGE
ncbi:MAG: nucleoside hydrolase [Terriglobia bacterium]|jgi:inosine-uridine nucleoside N-ribohydrolase